MSESVWDYPRPPRVEPVSARLAVDFAGIRVAETSQGARVLETSHPPVYRFPAAGCPARPADRGAGQLALRVQGPGAVFHPRRGRAAQPPRRLVLSRSDAGPSRMSRAGSPSTPPASMRPGWATRKSRPRPAISTADGSRPASSARSRADPAPARLVTRMTDWTPTRAAGLDRLAAFSPGWAARYARRAQP